MLCAPYCKRPWQRIFPPYSALLWYAVHLHMHWGIWMWAVPEITKTTPFWGIFAFFGESFWLTSAALILASLGTAMLMLWPRTVYWPTWVQILLASPQQVLLFLSMGSCLMASSQGVYADGTVHGKLFILSDQMASILAAPLHAATLWAFHWSRSVMGQAYPRKH